MSDLPRVVLRWLRSLLLGAAPSSEGGAGDRGAALRHAAAAVVSLQHQDKLSERQGVPRYLARLDEARGVLGMDVDVHVGRIRQLVEGIADEDEFGRVLNDYVAGV